MADPLRLFLIEDDDDFAFLMRKTLERVGHQITLCRTGADALIVLGHSQFDLVLLDQRLPDMSGLDLLQKLAEENIDVPVLMVTGYGDEHLATQVLRGGALDYVVKDRALAFLSDLPKRVHESATRHRLQQTNNLLIEALESARDGIIITDLQGAILHVNNAIEKMMGYSRAELLGQNPKLFKSGKHGPDVYLDLWTSILNRRSWQGELINCRKDGTLVDTWLSVAPIVEPRGRLTHFVGIYRDIGERKRMELQLFQAQKMQSVGTLAGGVAHEFNNLLAGIQGYASLGLREKDLSSTNREFFQFIVDLTDRAAHLTRQLLAYARKPPLIRMPVDVEKLLVGTADLIRHTLNFEVQLDIETKEPSIASVDQNQLQQVLVNLTLNVRDAMPTPPPTPVRFRLGREVISSVLLSFPHNVGAGDYVVIEIADRGHGMTPDVLAQAFDPFFTTKDVGQGTGLGLPVAIGIIQGHQGALVMDSEVGKGTRVRIFLPRLVAADSVLPQRVLSNTPVLEPESEPGKQILVIDDEAAVLDIICRFLEIAGHKVHSARSCQEGLEVLQTKPVDLVVLDWMIPQEDGAANFHALRQKYPRLPILLCTGLIQSEGVGEILSQDGVDFLKKPFRMNELWYVVNQALAGK